MVFLDKNDNSNLYNVLKNNFNVVNTSSLTYNKLNDIDLISTNELRIKYLSSNIIKNKLLEQYNDIKTNKRKIFTPGIFIGLQGRLNCLIITKHVIENELKWDFSDVVQKINYKILYKHHLRSIKQVFSNLYELILELYPNRNIKPYYFKKYRNAWKNEDNSLNHDLIKQAVRELITILSIKKKNYKINNIPKWISYNHFQKKILPYGANLSYLLSSIFNNSPIKAIMFTFPEMNLKPHYFKNVPKGFWKGNKGKNNAK